VLTIPVPLPLYTSYVYFPSVSISRYQSYWYVASVLVAKQTYGLFDYWHPSSAEDARTSGVQSYGDIRGYTYEYGLTHLRSFSPWVVDVGGVVLCTIPSTFSHVTNHFTLTPVILCTASFAGTATRRRSMQHSRNKFGCLANYSFTLPPISATILLQRTRSALPTTTRIDCDTGFASHSIN